MLHRGESSGAVLLDAGRSETGQAMALDRTLPAQELFDRQCIAAARLLQTEETAANCCYDFRLAANHPPPRFRWWKVRNREWTAIGPDDVTDAGTQLTVH